MVVRVRHVDELDRVLFARARAARGRHVVRLHVGVAHDAVHKAGSRASPAREARVPARDTGGVSRDHSRQNSCRGTTSAGVCQFDRDMRGRKWNES